MSLLGNVSNSSHPRLTSGEPLLKKRRIEKEEVINEIGDRSLSFSSKSTLDRFLPNRLAMSQAQITDAYFLKSPKNAYDQAVLQALVPYYSSKTLLSRTPKPYQIFCEPKSIWKMPNKPWRTYYAEDGHNLNDFYCHPLDWGRHIYFAINSYVTKLDQFTNKSSKLISFNDDAIIYSIKTNPTLNEVAIGDRTSSLSLFDLQAQQISLSHKVDSIYGEKIYCIGWRNEGNELTMGLNHAIVHLDKRQKCEAWKLSLEFGQSNCSIDWNESDTLLSTGNNANFLRVFDVRKMQDRMQEEQPVYKLEAKAAIKALKWNPNNPELLAIGSGTSDRHLYLIDLKEMKNVCKKNTNFQVCDLIWLDGEHFVISTGYASATSAKLSVWHYRKEIHSLKRIGVIPGFESSRALNLAKDPRSQKISSHCCPDNIEQQVLMIWEIENLEKTKIHEMLRKQRSSSMRSFDIR